MKRFISFLRSLFARDPSGVEESESVLSLSPNNITPLGTGGIKSPEDYRDVPLAAIATRALLPASYFVPFVEQLPIWHQRKLGACVGHAAAKYKQLLELKETGQIINLSPRYLYAMAKATDDFVGEGTYPRLVAKIVQGSGVATENTVPNNTNLSHEEYVYARDSGQIPPGATQEAKKYAVKSYAFPNVKNPNDLKRAIIEGQGTMLLMRLGKEWWTAKNGYSSWSSEAVVPLRPPIDIVSGHEVYLYGYETTSEGRTKFYIFNSWSADWGDGGKAWFYYDEYKQYLDEAVTFIDLPNDWLEALHQMPTRESFRHNFKINLQKGDANPEVKALQTALMIDGIFPSDLYATLLKNGELGYYGPVTMQAVRVFQKKYGISPVSPENAGPRTRTKLNELFNRT